MDWRSPLDEFTLRFLISQLTADREQYLRMAKEVKSTLEDGAGENFMIRAEECGRIIQQMKRQLDKLASVPPPPQNPRGPNWP